MGVQVRAYEVSARKGPGCRVSGLGITGGPGLLETMGANLVAAEFVSFVRAWDFGLGLLVVSGRSSRAPWEW